MTAYLGGVIKRVHNKEVVNVELYVRKPGALHRARFMASCLYLIKICMFQMQFETPLKNIQDALIICEYVVLIHAQYFLKCPLASCAPRIDRDFLNDIVGYKQCFDINSRQYVMIDAIQVSYKNHLWYLTSELVVFSFFDEELSDIERQKMAAKLLTFPRPAVFPAGKPVFPVDLVADDVAHL